MASTVSLLAYWFFCKQKTAYEMRISDWSSDVCSSDLRGGVLDRRRLAASAQAARDQGAGALVAAPSPNRAARHRLAGPRPALGGSLGECRLPAERPCDVLDAGAGRHQPRRAGGRSAGPCPHARTRSEEHTSELQAL